MSETLDCSEQFTKQIECHIEWAASERELRLHAIMIK